MANETFHRGSNEKYFVVGAIEKGHRGCHGKPSSWVPLKVSKVQEP